jgi:hypothetical protein
MGALAVAVADETIARVDFALAAAAAVVVVVVVGLTDDTLF